MQTVSLVIPAEIASEIYENMKGEGVAISEPVVTTSVTDALDAPISAGDVRRTLKIITLVFTTASAGLSSAEKLMSVLAKYRDLNPTVNVVDTNTGKTRTTLKYDTPLEAAQRAIAPQEP